MALPIEKPATWAEGTSSARRSAAASSAIASAENGSARHGCASRPAVVERGHSVAVGEPIELALPRLDGVTQATDQQDVRSFADLLGPDVEVAGAYVIAHLQPPSTAVIKTVEPLHGSRSARRSRTHPVHRGPRSPCPSPPAGPLGFWPRLCAPNP